jgi:hypothetical protein
MYSCLASNVIAKAAFQMCAGSEESDIVLLGEHTLVVLNSQGQLCLQKRFDYQPVAFTMYNVSALTFVIYCLQQRQC